MERKKKKRKELDKQIEDIENILEEENESSEDRIKRLEKLLEKLIEIAEEPDEEDEILSQIKSSLDDIRTYLLTKDESLIEGRLKELEVTIKDYMRKIREDENRQLEEIKLLLRSIQEKQSIKDSRIEELEQEIRNLRDIVVHINKIIDTDADRRKEALSELRERLKSLEDRIRELFEEVEDKESIKKLHTDLMDTRDAILYTLSKLEEMEAKDLEAVEHLVEEVRNELRELKDREMDEEVEKRLDRISKQLKAIISTVTKNSKALERYGPQIGEILEEVRSLEEQISSTREEITQSRKEVNEYMKTLLKRLDDNLSSLSSSLRDVLLQTLREEEKNLEKHFEELREEVSKLHDDVVGIVSSLKQEDIISMLKEVEEQLKVLSERTEKGIVDRKEIKEHIERLEHRLEDVENAIPREEFERVKEVLRRIESSLKALNEKIGRAGAVITEEDLKTIIRDIEELRVKARLLKDAGLPEVMEKLLEDAYKLRNSIKEVESSTVRIPKHMEEIEKTLKSTREVADALEEVIKRKVESIETILEHISKIGENTGVTGSHIIKKRVSKLKKDTKLMKDITSIIKRIESLTRKVSRNISTKRIKAKISVPDTKEAAMKILLDRARKLKPGESLDVDALARSRGAEERVFREAAEELSRIGEIALRLEKPFLPFFGGWKLRRL